MLRVKLFIVSLSLLLASACNLGQHVIQATPTPSPAATTTPIPPAGAVTSAPANTPTLLPSSTSCATPVGWFAYTIQRGDVLLNIARQSGTTVEELVAMNCIVNPNRVRAGDVIFVPNAFWLTPTPS